MSSNPAFLFLQEPLVQKQLSLITKTSLRGLDDSQAPLDPPMWWGWVPFSVWPGGVARVRRLHAV
jgi:hypothetical protein